MTAFTQKWTLVAQLDRKEDGYEFFWKDWPQHITIASTFALDKKPEAIFNEIEKVLATQKAIDAKVTDEVRWGRTLAMLLEQNAEIMSLHQEVFKKLTTLGAVFNEPQYVGAGYIPHSTVQKHSQLRVGDIVRINNISLVDMFPNGEGYQRKILKTMNFVEG